MRKKGIGDDLIFVFVISVSFQFFYIFVCRRRCPGGPQIDQKSKEKIPGAYFGGFEDKKSIKSGPNRCMQRKT